MMFSKITSRLPLKFMPVFSNLCVLKVKTISNHRSFFRWTFAN